MVVVPFLGVMVPCTSSSVISMVVQMSYNLLDFDTAKQVCSKLA